MPKRNTAFRKKFIRKLGINTKNFEERWLQVLFEEWPVVESGFDFVLTLKVLEDNDLDDDGRWYLS